MDRFDQLTNNEGSDGDGENYNDSESDTFVVVRVELEEEVDRRGSKRRSAIDFFHNYVEISEVVNGGRNIDPEPSTAAG